MPITQRELAAALAQHLNKTTTLERKIRDLTRQRDAARGRVKELASYVTKYQRELVALRRTKT